MNNFVQVEYKESTADPSISCVFQNLSDISEKECCIAHKLHMCDQKEVQDVEECDTDLPYRINLKLGASVTSGQRYCFTAIASNSTYTMKVEGSFIAGKACDYCTTCSYNYQAP